MASKLTKPKRPSYSQEDIAAGLRALALYGGGSTRAARALASDGLPVDKGTLESWREKYAVEYEATVYELRQAIGQKVSDGAMEQVAAAHEVETMLIEETQKKLKDIPAQALAKAALSMSQVKKTNVEMARLLRNEPTVITEVKNIDESLDELRNLGVLDVEAEEIKGG